MVYPYRRCISHVRESLPCFLTVYVDVVRRSSLSKNVDAYHNCFEQHTTVDLFARVFATENVLSSAEGARSNIREIGQAELQSALFGLKRDESVVWLISSPNLEMEDNSSVMAHAQGYPQLQCLLDSMYRRF